MNVLMTGGTGLIGKELTESLLADGHQVTVLTRRSVPSTAAYSGLQMVTWDAKSTEGWGHLVEETDAVVHLAGENLADGRWTDKRRQSIRDSRVYTGQALSEAIQHAQNKPSVLVQASGIGYYGPRHDDIVTESTPPGDDFLSSICLDWEAATSAVESLGVRRPVARSGMVLSTEGGALPRIVLPYKFFVGGTVGSGDQWWSWIHIADEVRALRFLMENDAATGAFNLSTPNPLTSKEFAQTVGDVMGRPSLMPVPSLALSTIFGEMSTVLLDGQRAIPTRLQELGFTFKYPALDTALKDLLS